MLSPETISAILEEFGGAPVSVQAGHCLNVRHKNAGCHLCADACPTDAIELQRGRPHLDPERCVRCGLCLHGCPMDVFTQGGAVREPPVREPPVREPPVREPPLREAPVPEVRLAQTVSMLPDDALALVCPQHDDPGTTSAPVTAVVRHRRCLASLSVPQLMEFSDGGRRTLWLDDSPCAGCPIGHVQPAIAQTAAMTNRLLQAFGRPPAIHTHVSHPDGLNAEPTQRPVIDGAQPALSRRGFFSAVGQLAHRTVASVIAETLPTPEPSGPRPVDQRLPHRIPASRARLLRQLKRLGTPARDCGLMIADCGLAFGAARFALGDQSEIHNPQSAIPFADVLVDGDACSACGLCAHFCPTGALGFVAEAESRAHGTLRPAQGGVPCPYVLNFRPAICINCGICAMVCPENAVSFGPWLAAAALIEDEPRPLVAGHLAACTGCGEPTASRRGAGETRSGGEGETRRQGGREMGRQGEVHSRSAPCPLVSLSPCPLVSLSQKGGDGEPRCYVCRQGTAPMAPLKDTAGLMADLLKRLPDADQSTDNGKEIPDE